MSSKLTRWQRYGQHQRSLDGEATDLEDSRAHKTGQFGYPLSRPSCHRAVSVSGYEHCRQAQNKVKAKSAVSCLNFPLFCKFVLHQQASLAASIYKAHTIGRCVEHEGDTIASGIKRQSPAFSIATAARSPDVSTRNPVSTRRHLVHRCTSWSTREWRLLT